MDVRLSPTTAAPAQVIAARPMTPPGARVFNARVASAISTRVAALPTGTTPVPTTPNSIVPTAATDAMCAAMDSVGSTKANALAPPIAKVVVVMVAAPATKPPALAPMTVGALAGTVVAR